MAYLFRILKNVLSIFFKKTAFLRLFITLRGVLTYLGFLKALKLHEFMFFKLMLINVILVKQVFIKY